MDEGMAVSRCRSQPGQVYILNVTRREGRSTA